MCGIVGITSDKSVTSSIINSLRKLEYRGYDSSGIATLDDGFINEVKCEGRVDNLEKNLYKKKITWKCWYRSCQVGDTWNSKFHKCSPTFFRESINCS